MTMEKIPVFFTFDKNYVVAAEVAIYSMLKHASPAYEYKLYVLHTDIPESLQKEMVRLVGKFNNASLEFIDTSAFDDDENILRGKAHFSKEIYYKLIAAEIFPQYDRIICSDVDVVFTGDISESYFMHQDKFFYFAGIRGQVYRRGNRNSKKRDCRRIPAHEPENNQGTFDAEKVDRLLQSQLPQTMPAGAGLHHSMLLAAHRISSHQILRMQLLL